MSVDSDQHRPTFRFRDKFSRFKDRVKDKIRDKSIKHNVTLFVHHNLTTNDTHDSSSSSSRHGFRQHMHHYKDVLKNKTHYTEIKDKIKEKIDDKFDLHDNKTYPKGFYDSIFSPETENDVYLQTALICLWVIAVLCIIPTIIVIFLPARKKTRSTTSTNMIFFHIFLCELCYLTYVLLAMINVAKDFRLASLFCDFANYGMYVTIPIMQFALLFLSLERLSKHFNLPMTWSKIFTKPYLIQLILCVIWIILVALLVTFMFIRKQFSFSFIKDKAYSLAPPIVGDVVHKLASRRHHCSIDGRLSSVFKTVIIILFILLIVKPILFSLGFNLLTPVCCRGKRRETEKHGDRRTTTLVTIFLVLNLIFSFPFYFVSMFNSILTRIDSTKDTFSLVLKTAFILRITNIIFECLAFYIFERNSWNLLSKLFYYGTCKKFPIFKATSDDDIMYTKDPDVQDLINRTRRRSNDDEDDDEDDDDDDDDDGVVTKKKRIIKKKTNDITESEPEEDKDDDDDDDGAFRKVKKKQSITEKDQTQDDSDEAEPITKKTKKSKKQVVKSNSDDDEIETKKIRSTKRTSKTKKVVTDEEEDDDDQSERRDSDDEDNDTKRITTTKRKSRTKKAASDDDEEEEQKTTITKRRKSRPKSDEDDEEEGQSKTKRRSHQKIEEEEEDDDDDDDDDGVPIKTKRKSRKKIEQEEEEEKTPPTIKRKSRPKIPIEFEQEEETIKKPKPKARTKVKRAEKEEEEIIRKPNSKSHHNDVEIRIPNGKSSSHRPTTTDTKRRSIRPSPSPVGSDVERGSIASHSSAKITKPVKTKIHSSSTEHKRTRTISPSTKRSHQRADPSPSSRPKTKKHHRHTTTKTKKRPKKDHHTRILEMSDEV